MPVSLIPSFLFYCVICGITPGPANLCSLSAAMKHGRKAALRQWRGLFIGFFIVSIISVFITAFFGQYFQQYTKYLCVVGAGYMLWLALHFLREPVKAGVGEEYTHCSFATGLLVQLANVKIMVFCVTALGAYVLPYTNSLLVLLAVGLFLPFTGPIMNLVWLFAGAFLQTVFQKHHALLNRLMALSLALCAGSLVI